MALLASSYVLLWGEERAHMATMLHVVSLAVGVIILDMGAQMTQVANQTRIFGLAPEARSRINTVYMTVYFTGAAIGSALATVAWVHWKWNGVCALAVGLIALAALRHATGCRTPEQDHCHPTIEDELMEA
jgi:predicted MFS family arabinose efflux permease